MSEMVTVPRDVLDQVDAALKRSYQAALVVKHNLTEPYADDPRWTPWTRWVDPAARQAHDARQALRKARSR